MCVCVCMCAHTHVHVYAYMCVKNDTVSHQLATVSNRLPTNYWIKITTIYTLMLL